MRELPSLLGPGIHADWLQRWIARIGAASQLPRDAIEARFDGLIRIMADHPDLTSDLALSLDLIDALTRVLHPEATGLPTHVTQRLAIEALSEAIAASPGISASERESWHAAILPWLLSHPYFVSHIERVTAQQATPPMVGDILAVLVTDLRRMLPADAVMVWRITDQQSPLVEVTGNTMGRNILLDEREDLATALHTGRSVVTGNRLVVPLTSGKLTWAVVDVAVPMGDAPWAVLHTLACIQHAEVTLAALGDHQPTATTATWQRILTRLALMLTVRQTLDTTLQIISDHVRQALPCERIAFWEYQSEANTFQLRTLSARVTHDSVPVGAKCPAADTPLLIAWYSGQPLLLSEGWQERFPAYPDAGKAISALAVIPVVFEYRTLGVLTVERLETRPFSREDSDWLMLVAALVASSLVNVRIYQSLLNAQDHLLADVKMRALGELASGIAHDMNNVLMAITCNIDLMGMASDLQQVRARLPKLEKALADAQAVVRRISAFGRPSARGAEFVPTLLAEVLSDAIEPLRETLTAQGIIVETRYDRSACVLAHPADLRQMVTNLVTNAIQAMPQGGTLTLSCREQDEYAWLSVEDTGIGMPPGVLARATDPLFTTRGGLGAGLGLSVVYRIAQIHAGVLHLASQEGQGTQAQVQFPIYRVEEVNGTAIVGELAGRRILLVEDQQDIADMLSVLLRHLGCQVTVAPGAREGAEACATEVFDLVITDLVMRDDTGETVARAAKIARPELPIVLLTGSLGLVAGHTDLYAAVVTKPVTLNALAKTLRRVLAREEGRHAATSSHAIRE